MPKKSNKSLRAAHHSGGAGTTNYRGVPRRITVKGVQRESVDLRKLSRALIQLAQAQAEADAQALAADKAATTTKSASPKNGNAGGSQ